MLLLATDKFCAAGVKWWRLLLAAAVGAAYSAMSTLWGGFWDSAVIKLLSAALMLLIAFGAKRKIIRIAAVFVICSAAFAGIVLAVSIVCGGFGAKQLMFSFAAAYALIAGILRFSAARGGTVRVVIKNRGQSISLIALKDTGSSLRDPVSGAAAIIAGERELLTLLDDDVRAELIGSRRESAEKRLELLWARGMGHGFKLLPYSVLGVENGLLLAFRVERVIIDGRERPGMIAAISPTEIAANGGYTAIVNGDIGG